MSEQAERQAQRLYVGRLTEKDRHSARARDERGVSIWAESRNACAQESQLASFLLLTL